MGYYQPSRSPHFPHFPRKSYLTHHLPTHHCFLYTRCMKHHHFFTGFGLTAAIILAAALLFSLYENNKILRDYKRHIFGMRADYKELYDEYNSYKAKTQNVRQLAVTNNTPNSLNDRIGDIIDTYTKSIPGDVSVYYKNLMTGETVIVSGDKNYYMASLYKVILTLYMLEEIKDGKIKATDMIGTITINEALNKIITESNNEYAQQLAERYGWKNIESSMKPKLGIEFSFNKDLQANVKNIGVLFEDIAISLRIPSWESDYLLNLLNNQKNTNKLPKYLPATIYTHNKTGEFGGYSHDAGIFYTPKANYVLVFMSNTNNPANTNEKMAKMSQEMYNTLNGIKN